MSQKKPFQNKMPQWWNRNGAKMEVKHADDKVVMLANSTASVAIRPVRDARGQLAYRIEWNLRQLGRDKFLGYLTFPVEYLREAFVVSFRGYSYAWKSCHRTTAAKPGYFVRAGQHLNIPGPGTGQDGDPNVSLLIEPEVREAIHQLIVGGDHTKARRPIAGPPAPEGYRSDNANTCFS